MDLSESHNKHNNTHDHLRVVHRLMFIFEVYHKIECSKIEGHLDLCSRECCDTWSERRVEHFAQARPTMRCISPTSCSVVSTCLFFFFGSPLFLSRTLQIVKDEV